MAVKKKTKNKKHFPDGNFCKIPSSEHWLVKSDLENLQLAKKHSSQLAVLSNFPFLTENTANKCVWNRPPLVYHGMNTSMTVKTEKVSFDVLLVIVGSCLKVLIAWCSSVHHSLSCCLAYIVVPARLTHCYENIQASHSEHVYIWLIGWNSTIIQSQT